MYLLGAKHVRAKTRGPLPCSQERYALGRNAKQAKTSNGRSRRARQLGLSTRGRACTRVRDVNRRALAQRSTRGRATSAVAECGTTRLRRASGAWGATATTTRNACARSFEASSSSSTLRINVAKHRHDQQPRVAIGIMRVNNNINIRHWLLKRRCKHTTRCYTYTCI